MIFIFDFLEPGYYKNGSFGIRIENVMIIKEADIPGKMEGSEFYCFEPVTLVPIQTKMIQKSLLTSDEIEWLNDYHQKTFEAIGALLSKDEPAYKWLERETKPI